jgi:tRNA pseudouridine38-40 synthase
MTVYRLVIEYDGTRFSGWQRQPGQRTVQGVLESALHTILRQPTRLQGAGRTDAGVHAEGQSGSFETDVEVDTTRLRKGLTALSRPDVAVVEAAPAPEGFNARFDAVGKHYRYTIMARPSPSPLWAGRSYFVPTPLDLGKMRAAAAQLVGEHDFAGFRSADCGRETTVRTLSRVSISRKRQLIQIDVEGTAFLKNMVRIIAGTLVDIGRGRLDVSRVAEVLSSGDRTRAGQTAPAQGLTLVEVFYPEGWIRADRKKRFD